MHWNMPVHLSTAVNKSLLTEKQAIWKDVRISYNIPFLHFFLEIGKIPKLMDHPVDSNSKEELRVYVFSAVFYCYSISRMSFRYSDEAGCGQFLAITIVYNIATSVISSWSPKSNGNACRLEINQ